MELREPNTDLEGHAHAVEYVHGLNTYTSRAAVCELKGSTELVAVETSGIVACLACQTRIDEALENAGRFTYHAPPIVHPPAAKTAEEADTELADMLKDPTMLAALKRLIGAV